MSFGTRYGFVLLLAGLIAPAQAQDRPTGAWKDPPARQGTASETTDKAATVPVESRTAAAERRPGTTTLRRASARRRRGAEHRMAYAPDAAVGRPIYPAARPYRYAMPQRRTPPFRQAYGPYPRSRLARFRNEGWGNLVSGSRASRIAEAEARGFIVMRARTFAYPNGHRMQMITPYYDEDASAY